MLPESQPSNSTLVWVLPSARDIIFILLFWSLLAGPLSDRLLADADIGWHIRAGEQILATRSVPRTDPFSSLMQGQPWFAWEWLYDLVLGIVHRAMGLNGVVWLAALLIATTITLLLRQLLKCGTGMPLALVLMLLAEAAATIHISARPHIVSWLFTLLWFIALERWQGTAPRWLSWFFPLSMVLWVNLHGGWIFGLALLAAYAVAAVLESVREPDVFPRLRSARRARRICWTFMWSSLATLANPNGVRLHAHIFRYLSDRYLMNRIDEFRSPDFHGWAERAFAMILVLTLIAFAGRLRRVPPRHVLVTLLAAYAGLYASRNLPVSSMLLALVAGPILWENLCSLAERPGTWHLLRDVSSRTAAFARRVDVQEFQLRGHLWPLLVAAATLAISLHGGRLGSRQVIQARFDPAHLPVAAVQFLSQQDGRLPVFAPDSWGGYLIYRMYPQRQVVIDDRHDLYGSGRFRDYLILMQVEPGWRDLLDRWQIRMVALPAGSTLVGILRELPQEWRVVYEDEVAVVMERMRP